MGTPVKPAIQFVSYFLTCASTLWLVTMVCDRFYALHLTYREEAARLADEEWLRSNCRDPVFYANLKGHTDVCAQVERNAMRNLVLFSLRKVMQGTYLCGEISCTDQAAVVLAWFMQLSAPLMILVSAMAVVCPFVLVQLVRVVHEAFLPTPHVPLHHGFYSLPVQPQNDQTSLPRYPLYRLPCFEDLDETTGKKGV